MLIGRQNEIRQLNALYESGEAELAAVYGRRRVGKTYLIDEVFRGKITFRHTGLSPLDERYSDSAKRKSRMEDQIKHFCRSLRSQKAEIQEEPKSWLDAFYLLEDYLEEIDDGSRQVVFIDEIQWMDTPRAGFMTGFEAFWNGWACHRHNIMVIVCGSSTSWILNNFVNNHGGLYDRVTYQIHLQPFKLCECRDYFQSKGIQMSEYNITAAYMMVGGIPYYLRYFQKDKSLAQNINAMFFAANAPLKTEYDRLFSSLFTNPQVMRSIIEAISKKNMGLTRKEIILHTGIPNSGELTKMLDALISGDFLMKYISFGGKKREEMYKLTDPFCLFYLKFVKEASVETDWVSIADSQKVTVWSGYAFENVCFRHIPQIKAALGISGVAANESLWSKRGSEEEDGTQIDMIIERRDRVINLCEIKFLGDDYSVNKEYSRLLNRRKNMLAEIIPKKNSIYPVLITTYGLKRNEYSDFFTNVITLDDLFRNA